MGGLRYCYRDQVSKFVWYTCSPTGEYYHSSTMQCYHLVSWKYDTRVGGTTQQTETPRLNIPRQTRQSYQKGTVCHRGSGFSQTKGPVTPPVWLTLEGHLLTPLTAANGAWGVQYLPWVINEHCLEFTQFSSRNIAVRVVSYLRMRICKRSFNPTLPGTGASCPQAHKSDHLLT